MNVSICDLVFYGIDTEITQKHVVKTYNEKNASSVVALSKTDE